MTGFEVFVVHIGHTILRLASRTAVGLGDINGGN